MRKLSRHFLEENHINYSIKFNAIELNNLSPGLKEVALRNELLADVFFKAGLIEAWGRGTMKITDECKKAGLPEPEFKEEFGGFAVYFYKDIYTEEHLRKMGLNERQIKAVKYVKEKGRITNREYQEITNVSRQMATIDLAEIVKKRVFTGIGKAGKGVAYQLTNK
ncbi:ATP-binding protein [Petrotoga sp. DB-2]